MCDLTKEELEVVRAALESYSNTCLEAAKDMTELDERYERQDLFRQSIVANIVRAKLNN